MLPTPVFWPGKFHGLYSPWGCEESDMIERTCHQQSNWFPAHLEGSTSHVCWLWGYLCWGTWWMCQGLQKSQDKHYAVLKHQYSLRIWENILYQNKDILCMYTCVCVCVCARTLDHVQLFVTPWTEASHAPLPMGFPRQEYWTGLPVPPPGDLLNPRT